MGIFVACSTSSTNLDGQIILAYGRGYGTPGYMVEPMFGIPELVVYDDGLTLFQCRYEERLGICKTQVSTARVDELIKEIRIAGFNSILSEATGSHGPLSIVVRSPEISETVYISTSGSPYSPPIIQVLEIMERFVDEVQVDSTLYQPKKVALWMFTRPGDCRTQRRGECDNFPSWPFEFSPPYKQMDECRRWLVIPQDYSTTLSAIPGIEKQITVGSYFLDGDNLISINVRPYLPGEKPQEECVSQEKWSETKDIFGSLPFYAK